MLVTVVSGVPREKQNMRVSGGFGDRAVAAGVQLVSGERSEVCGCIRGGKSWGRLKD